MTSPPRSRRERLLAALDGVRAQTGTGATLSPAHAQLVEILGAIGDRAAARQALQQAAALRVEAAEDVEALAFAAFQVREHERSRDLYQRFSALVPGDAQGWYNLASTHRNLGELDHAEAACDRALRLDPAIAQAALLRSQLRTQSDGANHVDDLRRRLVAAGSATAQTIFLHYALGKELEDLGDYDGAYRGFASGAAQRRATLSYDVSDDVSKIERIISVFSASSLEAALPLEHAITDGFVLGLPRSGTTMVERVLTNHPAAVSNGETEHLMIALTEAADAGGRDVFEKVAHAQPAIVQQVYRSLAGSHAGGGVTLEKLPLNYLYLGAVRLTMPAARVVLLRRSPLDNCLAMFSTLFGSGYPFSYDLGDLAIYYRAYHRLHTHWCRSIPDQVREIGYEDFVADPLAAGRAAAGHMGLAWNDSMAALELNRSASTTASAVQVRRPIYRSAVGRWRNYERQLEPLRRSLDKAGIDVD